MILTDKQYYGFIDEVKGIAILMVILVHTSQMYHIPTAIKKLCEFGQMGCQLFLVISGFTLMKSWMRKRLPVKNFI